MPPRHQRPPAVHEDHTKKKVQNSMTFAHLLQRFDTAAVKVQAKNGVSSHAPAIIIMNGVASYSQDPLTTLDGHLLQCKGYPRLHVSFGGKKRSRMSNPLDQLINLLMWRFVTFSMRERPVGHGIGIHTIHPHPSIHRSAQ